MKTLVDQLSNYAAYHRSQRNILTHLVGIPMIVLAIVALFSRPVWMAGGIAVWPAAVVAEVLFLLGAFAGLKAQIEQRVGAVRA